MLCDLHILVCNDYNTEEKGLLATLIFLQVSVFFQLPSSSLVFGITYSHNALLVFDVFVPVVCTFVFQIYHGNFIPRTEISLSLHVPPRFANT